MISTIPGREDFITYLDEYLARPDLADDMALIIVKINNLRRINMVFGYGRGNALLYEVYSRLKALVRDDDCVARVGDSEFGVMLPSVFNEGHVLLAINKVFRELEKPFYIDKDRISLYLSQGAAMLPRHARTAEALLQRADLALMKARSHKEPYKIFADDELAELALGWGLEDELDAAAENQELSLNYQPKIDMRSGRPYGVEALMRWNSPSRGFVSPDLFIAVAEESGRINELTWWVLNTALRESKQWPTTWGPLSVAVNASASMLHDREFVETVLSVLNIWGSENPLVIEVTESALMADQESSFHALQKLRDAGVRISIDDFGTGYSSLAYFKNIPANELKIDKSFVLNMLKDDADAHIVGTVIEMAHGFDLAVVAEGIEDQETFNTLAEMHCDFGQGFLMGRPMPQDGLLQWLAEYDPGCYIA